MNGGSRIIGIRQGADPQPLLLDTPAEPEVMFDEVEEPAALGRGLVVPVLAGLASAAWIGGMVWLSASRLPALDPVSLTVFIAALCVPPALLGILLLLALRTSRAEAYRFGRTAAAMRGEAASLERAVAELSRRIDDNRHKLADQTTALMAMGDGAVTRLQSIGSGMAEQLNIAEIHARRMADAGDSAKTTLDLVSTLLPKAQDETAAITRQMDEIATSATEAATALHAQLAALAERGRDADTVAVGAAQKLAAHITRMEATSETAGNRLEQVTGTMSEAVDRLLGRTADAIDEARKGIAAQGDAMLAMLGTNQAALDQTARTSADALAERIAAIEEVIDRIAARLADQRDVGSTVFVQLDRDLSRVSGQLETLHTQGVERSQLLAASISALGGSADAMTEALRAGELQANDTIGSTERLLVALDAAAREIDETLPDALGRLDTRIASSRRAVAEAKPELLALVTAAESTHDAIEAIAQVISGQKDTLDKLSGTLLETLNSGRAKADALGQMVDETIGSTHRFAEEAAPRLVDALLRVRDTAAAAADRARETLANVIPEAAAALEQASGDAMRRAATDSLEARLHAIGAAADSAAAAAERVAQRLSEQVLAISDAGAIVESRIEDARAEREATERDNFARRASLLIESLNSAAIDITRSFSPEVSDSAWAAYLKGDRGVFTRRAVRLLDAGEAREILRLYDEDETLREQVNRYIHDFEAMLRGVLTQRDGSPLGVTLLSSDMGKLYVALAQAIERLRT
ncbi:hypothetical protein [Sphingomonas aracearum]|uniref:ATPase n=1 Tax=Sphingomonas aracearum TaxID=2283317 RepID=A0A369VVY1_9SPHN|nr:hypothetical protein [Sphingomonas aracearum]RDE05330.1 hypothetical protein DVW87_08670 [Sphingomonas aracearum]